MSNEEENNLVSEVRAELEEIDASDLTETAPVASISGKVLVNAKVNYAVHKNINLYLSGRNILNQDSREVFGTDQTGAQLYAGASFNLN